MRKVNRVVTMAAFFVFVFLVADAIVVKYRAHQDERALIAAFLRPTTAANQSFHAKNPATFSERWFFTEPARNPRPRSVLPMGVVRPAIEFNI